MTPHPRHVSGVVAIALLPALLATLLAAPVNAVPTWLGGTAISAAGEDTQAPRVAVDAAGNATAVWLGTEGATGLVKSSTRPAGGPWSAPATLSAAGQNAGDPQIAVDPAGNATVVWSRYNGS